jgi:hypothetical protein
MIKIGEYNKLKALNHSNFGFYLTDGSVKVLLPNKYVPEDLKAGDDIEVFVYTDSEDRPVATTLKPKAIVGEFALLTVKEVNRIGAFLDWGLEKDLFVPFKMQLDDMKPGKPYYVRVLLDEDTNRVIATTKLKEFLRYDPADFKVNQEVDILALGFNGIGIDVIVNGEYSGMLYRNEVFKIIEAGDRAKAYVKKVREDGKLDLALQPHGYRAVVPAAAEQILGALKYYNGFLPVNDKTAPAEIERQFHMSKKTFKKAVGSLYKDRVIKVESRGITLLKT